MVAVAVGVGVGVGDNHGMATSSVTSTSTASRLTAPTTVASTVPAPLIHGIVNDSSFAAAITSDGVKHTFFQDINGTIRQATKGPSSEAQTASNSWYSPLDVVVASDARNYTPMAAIVRRYSTIDALEADEVISLGLIHNHQPQSILTTPFDTIDFVVLRQYKQLDCSYSI